MTSLILLDTPAQVRRRFVNNTLDAAGRSNVRAFWTPSPSEGLTAVDQAVASRVWTHGATPAGRLTPLGKGTALSFNGTSDYITTPDAADLSFGNGAVDSAFSVFAVANVTDSANARAFVGKWDTNNLEWLLTLNTADALALNVRDNSAAVSAVRTSDAVVPQGSWRTFGSSYDATGGATAANGMTLYQNGAVIASTATNNAGYVAMEDLAAVAEIGSAVAHTSSFFLGQLALVMVIAANLSAAQHGQLTQLARSYFGVPA